MANTQILVVDDDQSIRDILQKMLIREGYQPVMAATGASAFEQYQSHEFALVLLDLMLPDVSGLEIAYKLLEQNTTIPIILISAHGSISKAVAATKSGVYDFLEKPLDRDRLLVTIRNALSYNQLQWELNKYTNDALYKFQMIGLSPAMKNIFTLIEKVAPSPAPILITGENGVGKELVAAAIHANSARAGKTMVRLNCAAIPHNLLESELFGHTKGAFTGALYAKKGRLEVADSGTVFMDEIGDMPEFMQVKLLRFLENQEIQKVGSIEIKQVDVRLITATNQDLEAKVAAQEFREDLYYRINIVPINIPPLRERTMDIPPLLDHFLTLFASNQNQPPPRFTPIALRYLQSQPWPGNIRQLRNFVERLMLLNYNEIIDLDHVKSTLSMPANPPANATSNRLSLNEARQKFERDFILEALENADGQVSRAANAMGIDRANLYRKMRQLGIDLPKDSP